MLSYHSVGVIEYSREEGKHELLIVLEGGGLLGLELADELLAAAVGVHGGNEVEDGVSRGRSGAVEDGGALGAVVGVAGGGGLVVLLLVVATGAQEAESQESGGSELQNAEDGEGGGEGADGTGEKRHGEGIVQGDGGESAEDGLHAAEDGEGEEQDAELEGVHCVVCCDWLRKVGNCFALVR